MERCTRVALSDLCSGSGFTLHGELETGERARKCMRKFRGQRGGMSQGRR